MLEVFINFICAFMLALLGFYIIRKTNKSNERINLKNLIFLTINAIFITMVHYTSYNTFSVLINFIINTITYKLVFKNTIEEAVVETGILSVVVFSADVVFVIFQILFIPIKMIRTNIFIYLLSNIMVALIAFGLTRIKFITQNLNKYFKILSSKNLRINVIFIILIMISASSILYSVIVNYEFNIRFFSDSILMAALVIIGIIFTNNRDNYNNLLDEYDVLLSNVQNFEEWIENEQFIRHEYKNQLAVLYELSKDKKVKEKIQEIINQNLNIDNSTVYSLKELPKGGLKGLMYYKSIVAQNNNINLTIDVSIKEKGILTKFSEKEINDLAKILGIFYDNAIEAAKECRKKNILLEIYELKDSVNIVISNTFKGKYVNKKRFDKGVSTKGLGRGNGLYFAKKILNQNKWIKEKREIIDNYYIETIKIFKNTSKK